MAAGPQDGTGGGAIREGPRHVSGSVELARAQGCAVDDRVRGSPGDGGRGLYVRGRLGQRDVINQGGVVATGRVETLEGDRVPPAVTVKVAVVYRV